MTHGDDWDGPYRSQGVLGLGTTAVASSGAEPGPAGEESGSGTDPETLALLVQLKEGQGEQRRTRATQLGVLAISLLAFVSLGLLQWSIADMGVLVVVLAVHEMGHYLAMQVCGYRDVRIFFIPLFGAATSSSASPAAGHQRTLVALAGPIPGIAIGLVLSILYLLAGQPLVGHAAEMFLGLNAFNLLPLLPLDGGHVLRETVFSRNRWLETVFQALAAVAVLALAVGAGDFLFGVLGVWMLVSLAPTFKINRIAASLRTAGEERIPGVLSEIPLDFLVRVSRQVEIEFGPRMNSQQIVGMVRTVIEKLLQRPPAVWATVLLLGAYCGGFLLAFVGMVLIVVRNMPAATP